MPKSSILGPGTLAIGPVGDEQQFAAQLTKCKLAASVDTDDDVDTLDGGVLEGDDTFTWALSGTVLQDYDLNSLEDWCFEQRGKAHPFTFTPNDEAASSWSGTVKIRPLDVGGDVKKRNTSDFEFPLRGEPSKAPVA